MIPSICSETRTVPVSTLNTADKPRYCCTLCDENTTVNSADAQFIRNMHTVLRRQLLADESGLFHASAESHSRFEQVRHKSPLLKSIIATLQAVYEQRVTLSLTELNIFNICERELCCLLLWQPKLFIRTVPGI